MAHTTGGLPPLRAAQVSPRFRGVASRSVPPRSALRAKQGSAAWI